jgi:hypothetical protein
VTALATREPVTVERHRAAPGSPLGEVPLIAFIVGIGLLLSSGADALARATLAPAPLIFWAGVLIIGVPIFYRLLSPEPSSRERLTLVCLLGMALYGVKLAHNALFFALPDEFAHGFNAEQIVDTHHLFHDNPVITITPDFPGLEGATSALMTLTGMSSFGAGILVIGAARLTLVVGLFLLFRRVSGSARTAGIAAAVYAGSSNFLLWGAQYSYQSLALPLFVVVLVALAEREAAPRSWALAWAVPIVLVMSAVVVTHHLTSYAMAGILALLALLYWWVRRDVQWPNPWPFAVLAAGLAAVWLAVAASATLDYLSPVISRAYDSAVHTITGEASARALFQGSATDPGTPSLEVASTPLIARIVSLGSVAILLAGLPFGLLQVWRRHRNQPLALLLCGGAIGFFGILGLRFAPEAWETSNRAGEFMFIGLSFVLAFATTLAYSRIDGRGPRSAPWLGRAVLTGMLGVVLVGGAISGWPWDAQLAQPIRGTAKGNSIESEPWGMAEWVGDHLPGRRFAATIADARLLLTPGGVKAQSGRHPDVEHTLTTDEFLKGGGDCVVRCGTTYSNSFQRDVLRRLQMRYVIPDRRVRSSDNVRGYAFGLRPPGGGRDRLLPAETALKFEQIPTAARLFDSGNIVIYDIRARR